MEEVITSSSNDDSSSSTNDSYKYNDLYINSENDELLNENNIKNKIDYCPPLNSKIINDLNDIFEKAKLKKNKKIVVGVIKFEKDGNNYIHCPIKELKNEGTNIIFGVCNFPSLLDTPINRRKLSLHKYHFHYLGQIPNLNTVNVCLKTTKSIEDSVRKVKEKELKESKKKKRNEENTIIYKCIHCHGENIIKRKELLGKLKREIK